MLKAIIIFSIRNKFLVLAGTAALIFGGIYALLEIPLDAIPALSATQVIIYTRRAASVLRADWCTISDSKKEPPRPKGKVLAPLFFSGFLFRLSDLGARPQP